MPTQNPTTLEATPVPELFSECTDTPNYLDMWGGGCADYELPGNEAWCGGYGNTGEEGETPNENCCVCKALVNAISSVPTPSPIESESNETSNPSPSPSTQYPTSFSPYSSFASLSSTTPTEEVCPDESVAFKSCMLMDLDDLDDIESYLDCSMCGVEALGDDFMSFNVDIYCERWNTCVSENCSESCKDPIYAYQRCLFEEDGIALDCFGSGSSVVSFACTVYDVYFITYSQLTFLYHVNLLLDY